MLKSLKSLFAFLVATCVCLTLFLLAEKNFSNDFNSCTHQQISSQTTQNGSQPTENNQRDSLAVIGMNLRCSGDFIDKHNGGVTALATLLIAAFTFTLWWASAGQYDLLEKQIKLAGDEFNATHRPKIRVRFFPELPIKRNEPLIITYEAVNIGDADATIIGHELSIYDFYKGETSNPVWSSKIRINKETLIAGEASPRYEVRPQLPPTATVAGASHNIADMWVRGFFRYSDARGVIRKTQFVRKRDTNSLALRVIDVDRDYEYED